MYRSVRSNSYWILVQFAVADRTPAQRRERMEIVSLEQVKQEYAGQWVAFLVTEEKPSGELLGQLIAHHLDRRELHQELREKNVERVYVTFAGPVVKPGYAVIL